MQINVIITKLLDFENNYNILLIPYNKHINSRPKDIDMIIFAPKKIYNT